MPAPAPQGQQQQPPFGSSPATGPTLNKGYEAAAVQRLGLITKQLTELLNLAGPGSEIGKDLLKMLNIAVKHAPSGTVNPAQEKNNIENMAMRNAQQNQQMQQMKQQSAQGQMPGQGQQPQQAPGGPPQMPRAA